MRLSEKLSLLRKEKGLTQSELAERMDVSRQAVSRWEAGESTPSTENLRRLCELYDVPLDELFNGSRREPEKKPFPKQKRIRVVRNKTGRCCLS